MAWVHATASWHRSTSSNATYANAPTAPLTHPSTVWTAASGHRYPPPPQLGWRVQGWCRFV